MEGKDAIFLCYHVWLLEERVYDKRLHLPLASHRKVAWIDQSYVKTDQIVTNFSSHKAATR